MTAYHFQEMLLASNVFRATFAGEYGVPSLSPHRETRSSSVSHALRVRAMVYNEAELR